MQHYGWGLPINISTHGDAIDRIIIIVHVFIIVLFLGWLAFFALALWKSKNLSASTGANPPLSTPIPKYLEIFIAVFEIVLLMAFSLPLMNKLNTAWPNSDRVTKIRVIAEQYAWNMHYPGADGVFGRTKPQLISALNPIGLDPEDERGLDDIRTYNDLRIPVNAPIEVMLSSKDVIHGFSLPVMRVKQDIIPGQVGISRFEATQTGDFEIACTQLCGLGHYRMRGNFIVMEQNAFDQWLGEIQQ